MAGSACPNFSILEVVSAEHDSENRYYYDLGLKNARMFFYAAVR